MKRGSEMWEGGSCEGEMRVCVLWEGEMWKGGLWEGELRVCVLWEGGLWEGVIWECWMWEGEMRQGVPWNSEIMECDTWEGEKWEGGMREEGGDGTRKGDVEEDERGYKVGRQGVQRARLAKILCQWCGCLYDCVMVAPQPGSFWYQYVTPGSFWYQYVTP